MNKFLLAAIGALSIIIFSCKRSPISKSVAVIDTVSFDINNLDYKYFSAKSKVKYQDASNQMSFTVNSRIRKDSIIWLSVSPAVGIEAARVLIKKDSIFVLDRLNNTYYAHDYEFFENQFGIDLSYSMLEGIFLGNLLLQKTPEDQKRKDEQENCFVLLQHLNNISIENRIEPTALKIKQVYVKDSQGNSLISDFTDFSPLNDQIFAYKSKIKIEFISDTTKKITTLNIEHNKAEISENELNFPFNVPSKFEHK